MISVAGIPQYDDYKVFDNNIVSKSFQPYYFKTSKNSIDYDNEIVLNDKFITDPNITLDEYMEKVKIFGLLIIRSDTILLEKYHYDLNANQLFNSMSMAKPILSTLIEMAIEEGKITSREDYLVDYLPEFKNKKGFNKIKVSHLIDHESGIFVAHVLPDAPFYWGSDLRKLALRSKVIREPGAKFKYSSINLVFLGLILEKAIGTSLSNYLTQKLWQPLGMESDALWSVDSKRKKERKPFEKAFCCINAKLVDFAKIGKLFMQNGVFNGDTIVSSHYIQSTIHQEYDTKRKPANKKKFFYNNWVMGPKEYGSFFAWGLWGQIIYVYPPKKIIIVQATKYNLFKYNPNYIYNSILQIIDQL